MPVALDLDDLPPPPSAALPWIFAALLLAWLALRVWIWRRRLRSRDPGDAESLPPGWLASLAQNPLALPALWLLCAGCAAAAVLSWR